jgi:hypothetical protein
VRRCVVYHDILKNKTLIARTVRELKETYDASPFFGYLVQGVVHLAAVGDVAPDADDAVLVVAHGSALFPRLSDGSWEGRVGVPGGGEQSDVGTSL